MPQQDQQELQDLQSNLDLTSRLLDETHRQMPRTPVATPTTDKSSKSSSNGTTSTTKSSTPQTSGRVHVDTSYITRLPSFAQRGKAVAEKLEDIKKDPEYQKLSPDKQAHLRGMFYNRVVAPSYAGFHLPVPDEKTWVGSTAGDTKL